MVIMKQHVKNWLPYIKADLVAAEILLNDKRKNRWTNIIILWHCQQAIEKSFKAIIAAKGKELLKIHDLAKLSELAELELDEDDIKFILSLNNYYLRSRYPDIYYQPAAQPDNRLVKKYYNQTIILHQWLINYLKKIK
jgi:HEPN domain-containing protein